MSNRLNIELPYDLAIPLLGISLRQWNTHALTNVFNNCIHNSQKVKTVPMPDHLGVEEGNMEALYSEIQHYKGAGF